MLICRRPPSSSCNKSRLARFQHETSCWRGFSVNDEDHLREHSCCNYRLRLFPGNELTRKRDSSRPLLKISSIMDFLLKRKCEKPEPVIFPTSCCWEDFTSCIQELRNQTRLSPFCFGGFRRVCAQTLQSAVSSVQSKMLTSWLKKVSAPKQRGPCSLNQRQTAFTTNANMLMLEFSLVLGGSMLHANRDCQYPLATNACWRVSVSTLVQCLVCHQWC